LTLTAGTRLGPYEIVGAIGAGGMGEVYRARDPRLGRDVAVKVLFPSLAADRDRLDRFEREARAVAALSHPNVLAIYDVGTGDAPYLVAELLEGETLRALIGRGALPARKVVELALQLVAGLAAAHARGIVHRDLKPENVFLTRDGVIKILDFGLAKAIAVVGAQISSDLAPTSASGTLVGSIRGTVGYMAPEQLRGMPVDHRADLFAVGAIMHELATGHRAFHRESGADTVSAILHEQPPDLALCSPAPAALARIVHRCLEKDPNERFQTARDLRFALESMQDDRARAVSGQAAGRSIAVLPFANMSADPDNQYFSDGLAEELINALTRLPGLQVASRTSAFRFRGRDLDIRQIGKDLQVAAILEGSVRRGGSQLRVTAQLINVADGYHLWSERYDREMADVFAIQDDIVESIVKALAPALAGEAKSVVRRPTENLEAYQLYLRGRHYWHHRSPSALQSAMHCFEQVIALDAEYALAYAGLGDCFGICRAYGWFSTAQSRDRAREAVSRAWALAPSLPEVNFSRAAHIIFFEPNWREAEYFLRQAIAANPRMVDAHGYLGLVLAAAGRADEALAHAELAREIDPLLGHFLAATAFCTLGRFDLVETTARRILEFQADSLSGLWPLGLALSGLGRSNEAVPLLERAVLLSRAPFYVGLLGMALGRAGRAGDAMRLLAELQDRADRGEYVAPFAPLCIYLGLDDLAGVRSALAACVADSAPLTSIRILCGPSLDHYRRDSDIARLIDALHGRSAGSGFGTPTDAP
jgi:serine/threonine protein kinase